VHLVGFLIRICHDARSHERKKNLEPIHIIYLDTDYVLPHTKHNQWRSLLF